MVSPAEGPIRILIVDDHPVVRAGLTSMLSTQPGFQVLGNASNGTDALALMDADVPDIVLLDLRMPGMTGIDVLHVLRRRGTKCRTIILTSFETDEDIYQAVQAGAQGYLLKNNLAAGTGWRNPCSPCRATSPASENYRASRRAHDALYTYRPRTRGFADAFQRVDE